MGFLFNFQISLFSFNIELRNRGKLLVQNCAQLLRLCHALFGQDGSYHFFGSRTRSDAARVKSTASSAVVVLISLCRLSTLTPVIS